MPTILAPHVEALLQKCAKLGLMKKVVASARSLIAEERALRNACKKGHTRGTPRGVKAKGREGVVMARDWLLRVFLALQPDDVLIQTTSVGGSDIHYSPLAARLFPFAPESKRVQALNIWGALHQAETNAKKKGLRPVLFFSRAAASSSAPPEPLYIAFRADDLHAWLASGGLQGVRWRTYPGDKTDADGTGSSDQVAPEAG